MMMEMIMMMIIDVLGNLFFVNRYCNYKISRSTIPSVSRKSRNITNQRSEDVFVGDHFPSNCQSSQRKRVYFDQDDTLWLET